MVAVFGFSPSSTPPFCFPGVSIEIVNLGNPCKHYIIASLASKMSDNYNKNCWYFEEEIRVAEQEIRYTYNKYARNIVCTLEIPNLLLKNGMA